MRFQGLAVVLGKKRWPELIARQRKKDSGLDAYAPASLTPEKIGKGLAASITPTLKKVSSDVETAKRHFADLKAVLFVTQAKVGNAARKEWEEVVQKDYGVELHLIEREEVITLLMMPENASLRASFLHLDGEAGPEIAEAIQRYRDLLVVKGRSVDLTAIGLSIPPMALSDMDAEVWVRKPDEEERARRELVWAFRLRGRCVLTGLPGGGKSTALSSLVAEWSRRTHWALPIYASLRRLAEQERFRKRPLREDLLDMAVEFVDTRDRRLVRDSLDDALRTGHAAIFLDGLDEAANRSLDMASDIAGLLRECHPDTDVLVATRDVAYADARILGFSDLRLCAPAKASRLVRQVLLAIARHRGITEEDSWIDRRSHWVSELLERDRQLAETPLLPLLLAVLAADTSANDLPTSRSLILSRIVHDFVRRKEATRTLEVAGIPDGLQAEAILGAFPVIAMALATAGGTARRDSLTSPLATYLEKDWRLPRAMAKATATQILVVWDESGMFVATGADKVVAPRLQLFLEIGAAMFVADLTGSELDAWIASVDPLGHSKEIIVLSAGLCPRVAEALIGRASADRTEAGDAIASAVAEALSQGAQVSEPHLRALVVRLSPILERGDASTWRVLECLFRIRIPIDLHDALIGLLQRSLPPDQCAVAEGLASVRWNWAPERRLAVFERVLRVPRLGLGGLQREPTGGIVITTNIASDELFMEVLEAAAMLVLPERPDLAPVVASAIEHASWRTADRLRRALRQHGHSELAMESLRLWRQFGEEAATWSSFTAATDEAIDDVLKAMSHVAPPRELTLREARRLTELAALAKTLDMNYSAGLLLGGRLAPLRPAWIRLIATLGGFDHRLIAAQAAALIQEGAFENDGAGGVFSRLFDVGEKVELVNWQGVADQSGARELLLQVLDSPDMTAVIAATALASHPDREGTATAIQSVLPDLSIDSTRAAVWAYLELVDDKEAGAMRLAGWPQAFVRRAVAEFADLVKEGKPTGLCLKLAGDPVRQVRGATLERIEADETRPATDELQQVLREWAESPETGFTCDRCGTVNEAGHDSCIKCHIVTRSPASRARQILAKAAS